MTAVPMLLCGSLLLLSWPASGAPQEGATGSATRQKTGENSMQRQARGAPPASQASAALRTAIQRKVAGAAQPPESASVPAEATGNTTAGELLRNKSEPAAPRQDGDRSAVEPPPGDDLHWALQKKLESAARPRPALAAATESADGGAAAAALRKKLSAIKRK